MKVNVSDLMHNELTLLLDELQKALNEYDTESAREILMNIASGKVIDFPSKSRAQRSSNEINT